MKNKKLLYIIIPPVEKQYVIVNVINKTKYFLYSVENFEKVK